MGKRGESTGTRHLQVKQQKVGVRVRFDQGKQRGHAVRLEQLHGGQGLRRRSAQRIAKQGMVVGNEDFRHLDHDSLY